MTGATRTPRRRRGSRGRPPPRPAGPGPRLADAADAGQRHQRHRSREPGRQRRDLRLSRPTNVVTCGQVARQHVRATATAGTLSRAPGRHLEHVHQRLEALNRSRSRCSPRSTSSTRWAADLPPARPWIPRSRAGRRARLPSTEHNDSGCGFRTGPPTNSAFAGVHPHACTERAGMPHGSEVNPRCASTAAATARPPRTRRPSRRPLTRHHAPVPTDRVLEDDVMAGHRRRHRLPTLLPQARRTLEVGEQERHRPGRKRRRHRPSMDG